MHTTSLMSDVPTLAAADALRARLSGEDLYEFRRTNYADGWDSDDADLGWVDQELVVRRRRAH